MPTHSLFKCLSLPLMFAASWGTLTQGVACATEPPQSLEQVLDVALVNHPDIVASQARVKLAEAEMNNAKLEVMKQVSNAWIEYVASKTEIAQLKDALPGVSANERSDLEAQILKAQARHDAKIHELNFHPRLAQSTSPAIAGGAEASRIAPEAYPPLTREAQLTAMKLTENTDFEFAEVSLKEVVEFLNIKHKLQIQMDPAVEDSEVPLVLTMKIRHVSLASALQAMEDRVPSIRFVMRDYGILLTTVDNAQARNFVSVRDYARDFPIDPLDFRLNPEPKPESEEKK